MFKRYFLTTAAAIACATAFTSAQTPATGAAPQVPPAAQSAAPSPQSTTTDKVAERAPMTVTGCLVREQDIPGHAPSDADRAGRLEDYILTSASSARAESGKPGANPSGAVGTSGTSPATAHIGPMYKIKGISDMQLKSLAGKRVEVVGLMNAEDTKVSSSAAAPSARTPAVGSGSQTQTGTDANAGRGEEKTQWSSFAASSIREVPGSCQPAAANR
jgi:hypothetical protein